MNGNPLNSTEFSRRAVLRGFGVGGTLVLGSAILAACAPVGAAPSGAATAATKAAKAAVPVTLQLDWIPFGRHAPYYAAQALGYYKDAGVDITLLQGAGVGPGYASLVAGKSDVSFNDFGYLPQAVSQQKLDMVATAVFYAVAPHSVFFLKSSGIKKPKDLEGKTIAYTAGTSPYLLFPLFAQANNFDASKVKWQQVSAQALNQTFLSGQADAMVTYALTQPVLQDAAPTGQTVDLFMFGDYHVSLLNNGLIFEKSYVQKNPELVKGITQATVKGYKYAFANPEKAMNLMAKSVPTVNVADGVKEIKIIEGISQLPEDKKAGRPLGWINPSAMAKTVTTMSDFFKVSPVPDPTSLYTNKYL